MRFVDEYRDPALTAQLAARLRRTVTRPWVLMEVCGGQTHAVLRHGLDRLLPEGVELIHGPGCPVCVTPVGVIDQAVSLARMPGVTVCSFGDMLRVPGTTGDLTAARAAGGDVRPVYSPLDAVRLAKTRPERQVVFLAVGFETTAPATALAVVQARALGLTNFSLLLAHVLVPPAMAAVLAAPGNRVQAFLAAGHVCTITGADPYRAFAAEWRVPVVVTGFEPVDLLEGIWLAVSQLETGRAEVENAYTRVARSAGNSTAQAVVEAVYEPCDREWRGLGILAGGGLRLTAAYRDFDAQERFGLAPPVLIDPGHCRAGEVLQGRLRPDRCPEFGRACTPESPLGAPMVSAEGACAAYWRYRGAPA